MLVGRHLFTKYLEYRPGWLSCDESHIYIPDINAPALNIYTWTGELVKTFDSKDLALHEEDLAWDVSPSYNGNIIMHCQKHNSNEHQFHAYKLNLT